MKNINDSAETFSYGDENFIEDEDEVDTFSFDDDDIYNDQADEGGDDFDGLEDEDEDGVEEDVSDEDAADDDGGEPESTEQAAPERVYATDEAYSKFTHNGQEIEQPVKVLVDAYLRQNEVEAQRQAISAQGEAYVKGIEDNLLRADFLLKRAHERFDPFTKLNWAGIAAEKGLEAYNDTLARAEDFYADIEHVTKNMGELRAEHEAHVKRLADERINTAVREALDPETGIKDFSMDMFKDMTSYAVGCGWPEEEMHELVRGPALRMLHDAMRFRKAEAELAALKPVEKRGTRVLKSNTSSQASRNAIKGGSRKARAAFEATGSREDAIAALLEQWDDDE